MAMTFCPKLGPIVTLSECNGDFSNYQEYLYSVFKNELYNNKVYYNGKPISLRRNPEYLDKEYSFFHLTCKDFDNTGNEEDRVPDLRRCERLHWIKPGIETDHMTKCNQLCFKAYTKTVRNKERVHLFNESDRYMIVLEERSNYYLLVTAYYIEYDNTLQKKIKESQKLSK